MVKNGQIIKTGQQVKLKAEIDALEASLVAQGGIDESTIDQSRTDTGVGESVLPTTSKTEETKSADTETVGTTSKSTDDTTTGTVTGAGKESSTLTKGELEKQQLKKNKKNLGLTTEDEEQERLEATLERLRDPLTPEAISLLASVDAGGVPAMITNNLKKNKPLIMV